jgi:hypothetical protein
MPGLRVAAAGKGHHGNREVLDTGEVLDDISRLHINS